MGSWGVTVPEDVAQTASRRGLGVGELFSFFGLVDASNDTQVNLPLQFAFANCLFNLSLSLAIQTLLSQSQLYHINFSFG